MKVNLSWICRIQQNRKGNIFPIRESQKPSKNGCVCMHFYETEAIKHFLNPIYEIQEHTNTMLPEHVYP